MRKIIDLYKKGRKPAFPSRQIQRGRSRTVSGLTEDLFAKFLSANLRGQYKFLVDQPISLRKKTIYPDILIIKKGEIVSLLDLKMDLGWKRTKFVDFCKQKDKLMGNLKNSVVSYTDHTNEVRKELKTSGKIYYQIVIVSNRNISKEKWASNQAQITDLKSVNNYVLTEDVHPNYLSKNPSKAFSDMKINLGEFKKLLKDIRRF